MKATKLIFYAALLTVIFSVLLLLLVTFLNDSLSDSSINMLYLKFLGIFLIILEIFILIYLLWKLELEGYSTFERVIGGLVYLILVSYNPISIDLKIFFLNDVGSYLPNISKIVDNIVYLSGIKNYKTITLFTYKTIDFFLKLTVFAIVSMLKHYKRDFNFLYSTFHFIDKFVKLK